MKEEDIPTLYPGDAVAVTVRTVVDDDGDINNPWRSNWLLIEQMSSEMVIDIKVLDADPSEFESGQLFTDEDGGLYVWDGRVNLPRVVRFPDGSVPTGSPNRIVRGRVKKVEIQ